MTFCSGITHRRLKGPKEMSRIESWLAKCRASSISSLLLRDVTSVFLCILHGAGDNYWLSVLKSLLAVEGLNPYSCMQIIYASTWSSLLGPSPALTTYV